jgi:Xaa-Pro aminopeptidase
MTSSDRYDPTGDLAGFRRAQRLAYACATHVGERLEAGMTEKDAAAGMREYLARQGVTGYFHAPFAWFGERTELGEDWEDDTFLPSERLLEPGMPVILDVAPIVDGYAADIGYALAFGGNAEVERMLFDLEWYRRLIPEAIRAGLTLQEIYRRVDQRISAQGYRSCHHAYPAGVIAHQVGRLEAMAGDEAREGGFGASAVRFLLEKKHRAKLEPAVSPYWTGRVESAHRPAAGLWAVEPHLGLRGVGVKFEELLVVTEDDAYWLDDELPHVQRWRAAEAATGAPTPAAIDLDLSSTNGRY